MPRRRTTSITTRSQTKDETAKKPKPASKVAKPLLNRDHKPDLDNQLSTTNQTDHDHDVANSPFHIQTASLYLPLLPIHNQKPVQGICAEHLSPLLLTYFPPLDGVVLSYHNVRLSDDPSPPASSSIQYQLPPPSVNAKFHDDSALPFLWVTAEFVLLRARRGQLMDGWVNLQNESHLGLVCWNMFGASIDRRHLPKSWSWVDCPPISSRKSSKSASSFHPHFIDGSGNPVGGKLTFRITKIEISRSALVKPRLLAIAGTLLNEDDENKLLIEEKAKREKLGMASRLTQKRVYVQV